MPLQITPNPRSSGNLSISANQRARMSSVVSLSWSKITGVPDFAGEIADLGTDLAALDTSLNAQIDVLETEVAALAPLQYFTQAGTGAVTYTVASKIGQVFSAKDFGVKGDGTTADAVNLNKAIAAVIALGAGELWIPAGTYKCDGTTIIANLSAISTRFQGRIVIRGDGAATVIQNTTSAAACFKFLGNTANSESYFELRNIRFKGAASSGAAIAGSKGVEIDVCAFAQVRGVIVEGFEYGHDCTDVEQLEFSNCEFRWNKNGGLFRGVGSITDTNSVLITNCQYSNNALTGLTVNHGNAFVMNGGSIQYNGLVGGASNTGGLFLQEFATGYGTGLFLGVAFEGNGGIGDVDSLQTTNPGNIAFIGCGFARTQTFGPTVGYGTNNFNARGTNANTIYRFSGNTFRFFVGYTESAARPTIALANTACKISDDGTNYFQSATEKLTYPVGQLVDPVFGGLTVRGTLNALGNGGFGGTLNVGGASTLGARITGPSGVAAVAYFVTPTGNDGNTGLSSGAACLTLQGVWTKAMLANNGSGGVTINIADGTYTNSLSINGAWNGAGPITIVGNVGSPANVLLSVTSDNAIRVKNANVIISGMEIRTATAGDCLLAYDGGEISFSNMRFGACAGSHLTAQFAGRIHGTGNYTITGSAVSHLHAFARGYLSLVGLTVTLTGTPAFSAYFAGVADASIGMSGVTFSGAATGKRFLAHDGGRIDTSGLGISGLPGSIAGTFDTWGQYDGVFSGTGDITGATAFFTNNVNATGFVGGTAANAVATVASTSSGAPSGDILNLVGSTISMTGRVGVGNTTPKAPVDLNSNLSSSPALAVSTSLQRWQASDGVIGGVEWVSYGATAQNVLAGAVAGGTAAVPAGTPASRNMFNLRGYGYNGTTWQIGGIITIRSGDSAVWSGTNQGTQVDIYTTPNGTTALSLATTVNPKGGLSIGSTAIDVGANTLLLTPQTFASLPAAIAGFRGAMATVTDSTTVVWGATITGGGANAVLAFCNGAAWTVFGK